MDLLRKTELHTPHFMTEKRSIFQFLIFVCIFATFFVTVYKPIGIIHTEDSLTRWGMPLYVAILVATGIVTLVLSRVILYRVQKHREIPFSAYVVWISSEIVVFTAILTTLAYFINANEGVTYFHLLWRVFVDIIAILFLPYVVTIMIFLIREKNHEIEALRAMQLGKKIPEQRGEQSFNFYDKGGKLSFSTRRSNVLYIEASDNYTNIHYVVDEKEDCFILHSSMKQVEEAYAQQGILRCHRKYLVNVDNVKLIRKDKDGLVIELSKTDMVIPVSKTYIDRVVHFFSI